MKRILFIVAVALALTGCKTKERVVTVPEVHTEYEHHTDNEHHTDSVIKEKETVIMQLDSAMMAQYGIQLKAAERAWLVKTAELEREIQRISQIKSDTIFICDSIPYPVPTPVEIPASLTWWQRTKMNAGVAFLCLIGLTCLIGLIWLIKKFWK